jgi:UDP-N-acetylmuramate dehydrogenase
MQIQENISLLPYNSFGLEARAQYYVRVEEANELPELADHWKDKSQPRYILGGGSNILLAQNLSGWVIHNQIKGIEQISEDNQHVYLKLGAGVVWHEAVMHAVRHNWQGIENLALIPGTCGAAPIQNIGAYGVELKDSLVSVEAFDFETKETLLFSRADCAFGYRDSFFKRAPGGRYCILSVTLQLHKNPRFNTSYGAIEQALERMQVQTLSVESIAQAVIQIRQSKLPDPSVIGNAGSFFKNPEISPDAFQRLQAQYPDIPAYPGTEGRIKIAAGWLIEQAGWKGYRRGRVGCHALQSLVLVNHGGATGAELVELAQDIQSSVWAKFEVDLVREVNIWP